MTLIELCEPIFIEACKVKQGAKTLGPGLIANLTFEKAQSSFRSLFAQAKANAQADPVLAGQFALIEQPLAYFIDDLMTGSAIPFAAQWAQSPLETLLFNTAAGAEAFYKLDDANPLNQFSLANTLKQPGAQADERLAIFYTCLCLGFLGQYRGNPTAVQPYFQQIQARLSNSLGQSPAAKLCPEAYKVNRALLWEKPTKWLKWIFTAALILAAGALVFCWILFYSSQQELHSLLKQINHPSASTMAN